MNWFKKLLTLLFNNSRRKKVSVTREVSDMALSPTAAEHHIKRAPKEMYVSLNGIKLIKIFEGFRAQPYQDQAGVWTIGYGTTGKNIHKHTPEMTKAEASRFLRTHVDLVERDVRFLVKVPLNQNQFDALVSFAYNVGTDIDADDKAEGLGDSTLLRKLNEGDYSGAAKEFHKWVFAGGKKRKGLQARRKKEHDLFLV